MISFHNISAHTLCLCLTSMYTYGEQQNKSISVRYIVGILLSQLDVDFCHFSSAKLYVPNCQHLPCSNQAGWLVVVVVAKAVHTALLVAQAKVFSFSSAVGLCLATVESGVPSSPFLPSTWKLIDWCRRVGVMVVYGTRKKLCVTPFCNVSVGAVKNSKFLSINILNRYHPKRSGSVVVGSCVG